MKNSNGKLANTIGPSLDLDQLATTANEAHAMCVQAANDTIGEAMTAGDALLEAKRLCIHGEWQSWLKTHVNFSDRTARVYMQLAKHRPEIESKMADETAVLTIDAAAKLIAAPKPVVHVTREPLMDFTVTRSNGLTPRKSAAVEFDPVKLEAKKPKQGREKVRPTDRKEALALFSKLVRILDRMGISPDIDTELKAVLAAIKA